MKNIGKREKARASLSSLARFLIGNWKGFSYAIDFFSSS